jgi:hypothetical protein
MSQFLHKSRIKPKTGNKSRFGFCLLSGNDSFQRNMDSTDPPSSPTPPAGLAAPSAGRRRRHAAFLSRSSKAQPIFRRETDSITIDKEHIHDPRR